MKAFGVFVFLSAFCSMSASAACTQPTQNIYIPSDQVASLSLKQDSATHAASVNDSTGNSIAPTFSWIKVWYANSQSETIGSIRDIVVAFATHEDAMKYVALTPRLWSEGAPQVEQYQYKGTTVTVFGPRPPGMSLSAALGSNIRPVTAYVYLSVTNNVVSKIFVMQGIDATTSLTPARGKDYANGAIDNMATACK